MQYQFLQAKHRCLKESIVVLRGETSICARANQFLGTKNRFLDERIDSNDPHIDVWRILRVEHVFLDEEVDCRGE